MNRCSGDRVHLVFLFRVTKLLSYRIYKRSNSFSIHSSMALQPFAGPWPLLLFRNHFYTDGRNPWTGDQPVARPLPTHRTTQTQNNPTHRHPSLQWDRVELAGGIRWFYGLVPGYRCRGPGFDSRRYQIFWEVVGIERGPLSLVRITEEPLEWKSSGSGLENRN
jgi:hypothetical protein